QALLATPAAPPVAPAPVVALADPASRVVPAAAAVATPPAISLTQLQQELRVSLAEALFMQPADIQARRSFTELGLDSIIGVEWVKALNKQYGTEVAAARIYDYPNIAELAVHLHEQIASAAPQAPAPDAAITGDPRRDENAASRYFAEVDIHGDFARDGEVSLHYLINSANNVSLQEHVLSGEHVLP